MKRAQMRLPLQLAIDRKRFSHHPLDGEAASDARVARFAETLASLPEHLLGKIDQSQLDFRKGIENLRRQQPSSGA